MAVVIASLAMLGTAVARAGDPSPEAPGDGPEIGPNDFRISDMGGTGDPTYGVFTPEVAYNGANHEYLVVWTGDDDEGGLVDDEYEIFAQRIDATTGAEVGANDFRISDMGGLGDPDYTATQPAVAYNPVDNEYLVVWSAEDNEGGLVEGEYEIFGQRLDAATGAEVGTNDFRISELGGAGDPEDEASVPAVVYNPSHHEFVVAWSGGDYDSQDIYGQRLDATTGAQVGPDDFRVSDSPSTGFFGIVPALAYNSAQDEYLVAWWGQDTLVFVDGFADQRIFAQRLSAAGRQLGPNDFEISNSGSNIWPRAAYDSTDDEYLVVWERTVSNQGIVAQRLDASGREIGEDDFYVSDAGESCADAPGVTYSPATNHYLVVWPGKLDGAGACSSEQETLGQGLDAATGAEVGDNDFRISDLGGTGDDEFHAWEPAVVYSAAADEYLAVWRGDDNEGGLVDDENEVFGQRLRGDLGILFADGFESGDTSGWSLTVR